MDGHTSQVALMITCLKGVEHEVGTRQLEVARIGPRNKARLVGSMLAAAKRGSLVSGFSEPKGGN